jgi:pimeloyl-ACP methyl ester carboxylesterase
LLLAAGLAYESKGDGDPILFIHGGAICDADLPLMSQPALVNYRLVRYHRRGYGSSARHQSHVRFKDQAEDAQELLKALNIERAHVVGHSYGGLIALRLAHDAPELVHTLTLSEPALSFLFPEPGGSVASPMARMAQMAATGDHVGAVNTILGFALGDDWRSEVDRMIPGASAQVDTDAPHTVPYESSLREWDLVEADFRHFDRPVLSILGTASAPRAWEVRKLLHTWFPQTADYDVPGANHRLQFHSPGASALVAEGIAKFVRGHLID